MTYQVIPGRDLIRNFKQFMERLIQKSGSISFSYKGEEFEIIKKENKSRTQKMLEKLRASSKASQVDTSPYETKQEIYSTRYE
jgi:hypothetical protein